MLRLTQHAADRIAERGLRPDQLAAALDGRRYELPDGLTLHLGPDRTALLVNPEMGIVITAYRMQRKVIKRNFSR